MRAPSTEGPPILSIARIASRRAAALIARVRVVEPAFAPAGWYRTARGWTRIDLDPHGHSRVMTFDFGAPCPDRRRAVTLEELAATFERIAGSPIAFADPRFMARFSDFSRIATSYRRGRLLLAGDAAHVHFPIGGQGLNLGIQGAIGLGWNWQQPSRTSAPGTGTGTGPGTGLCSTATTTSAALPRVGCSGAPRCRRR